MPLLLLSGGSATAPPPVYVRRPGLLLLFAAGGSPLPPLPYDLAEAIAVRFASLAGTTLAGFTKLYESAAGDSPATPYLVFTIASGTPELYTSTSQWDDHRVRFEVFADTQAQANGLRDALAVGASAAYLNQSLEFTSGVMTPMVRVDRMESRERKRTVGSKLVFKACAVMQTRVASSQ